MDGQTVFYSFHQTTTVEPCIIKPVFGYYTKAFIYLKFMGIFNLGELNISAA